MLPEGRCGGGVGRLPEARRRRRRHDGRCPGRVGGGGRVAGDGAVLLEDPWEATESLEHAARWPGPRGEVLLPAPGSQRRARGRRSRGRCSGRRGAGEVDPRKASSVRACSCGSSAARQGLPQPRLPWPPTVATRPFVDDSPGDHWPAVPGPAIARAECGGCTTTGLNFQWGLAAAGGQAEPREAVATTPENRNCPTTTWRKRVRLGSQTAVPAAVPTAVPTAGATAVAAAASAAAIAAAAGAAAVAAAAGAAAVTAAASAAADAAAAEAAHAAAAEAAAVTAAAPATAESAAAASAGVRSPAALPRGGPWPHAARRPTDRAISDGVAPAAYGSVNNAPPATTGPAAWRLSLAWGLTAAAAATTPGRLPLPEPLRSGHRAPKVRSSSGGPCRRGAQGRGRRGRRSQHSTDSGPGESACSGRGEGRGKCGPPTRSKPVVDHWEVSRRNSRQRRHWC
mmetsp:Transcript_67086/g.173903  ORF Transcript_67086/g.173903 Transcript_67086/m.173903 type:complete len:455 (-) Transcript_67086:237-1601(-)